MFSKLKNNPRIRAGNRPSEGDLTLTKSKLSNTAPDFLEFFKTFGDAVIGDGFFHFYDRIADLDEHMAGMGLGPQNQNAWVFGDGDGDMGLIDKKTGEYYQIDHEDYAICSKRYENLGDFITFWLLR